MMRGNAALRARTAHPPPDRAAARAGPDVRDARLPGVPVAAGAAGRSACVGAIVVTVLGLSVSFWLAFAALPRRAGPRRRPRAGGAAARPRAARHAADQRLARRRSPRTVEPRERRARPAHEPGPLGADRPSDRGARSHASVTCTGITGSGGVDTGFPAFCGPLGSSTLVVGHASVTRCRTEDDTDDRRPLIAILTPTDVIDCRTHRGRRRSTTPRRHGARRRSTSTPRSGARRARPTDPSPTVGRSRPRPSAAEACIARFAAAEADVIDRRPRRARSGVRRAVPAPRRRAARPGRPGLAARPTCCGRRIERTIRAGYQAALAHASRSPTCRCVHDDADELWDAFVPDELPHPAHAWPRRRGRCAGSTTSGSAARASSGSTVTPTASPTATSRRSAARSAASARSA